MNVPVGLLTAERQDVEPFDGKQFAQGAARAVHNPLESGVLLGREVGDDVLAVLDRRHEKCPVTDGNLLAKTIATSSWYATWCG